MNTVRWNNPTGRRLKRLTAFLDEQGLRWEEGCETTLCLLEGEEIVATGSREGNVLKCIGISPDYRGENLTATVVTGLVKDALAAGFEHLFLYTKPENLRYFAELGFYQVTATGDVALLENRRNGVARFVEVLKDPRARGEVGAIVANCNPFTNGHLYLIETAAKACDFLYLFILSEDRSTFPADVRLDLARKGTAHLGNVAVHPTGDYLISSATFPAYFLKEQQPADVHCELDLLLFAEHFAGPLGISCRYVGTEPLCPTTLAYNNRMKELLPERGIRVVEIPRKEEEGAPVSASRVRDLLAENRLEDIFPLVPPSTMHYLLEARHD